MHSKTLFKFLFNSPKTSTTSVHFIFFLNTTLHYGPNKIRTTPLGSTKLQIWILQNSLKTGINELASYNKVTDRRGLLVSWARAPVTRNRGGNCRDAPASFSSPPWRAQAVASSPTPSLSRTASREVWGTADGSSEHGRRRPWRIAVMPIGTPANSSHERTRRKALELPGDLTQR